MQPKKTLTSTEGFSHTILSARTPEIRSNDFTKVDFFDALKKVSRKEEPPAPPSPEKPKED